MGYSNSKYLRVRDRGMGEERGGLPQVVLHRNFFLCEIAVQNGPYEQLVPVGSSGVAVVHDVAELFGARPRIRNTGQAKQIVNRQAEVFGQRYKDCHRRRGIRAAQVSRHGGFAAIRSFSKLGL